MSFFEQADAIVAGIEAGYSLDPNDPGGETKYGISKRAYPNLDIANLTLEGARAIRMRDYWYPTGCEDMPWAWALCTYDCAINQGEGAEQLIAKHSGKDLVEFMSERAMHYAASKAFQNFEHGWFRRLFNVAFQSQKAPT